MIIGFTILLAAGQAYGQNRELITEEDFIRELAPGQTDRQPRLRMRSISVAPRPAPEVAIHLFFDFGSAELTDAFSRKQLHEAGKALRSPALAESRFEIAGYTDDVGSEAFNQALSEKRAGFVKRFLVEEYQIEAGRLESRGYGERQPVAGNDTADGRARNRRVVFRRLDLER